MAIVKWKTLIPVTGYADGTVFTPPGVNCVLTQLGGRVPLPDGRVRWWLSPRYHWLWMPTFGNERAGDWEEVE